MVLLRTVKAVDYYEQRICPYALTQNFLFDTVGLSDVFPGGTRHRHTHRGHVHTCQLRVQVPRPQAAWGRRDLPRVCSPWEPAASLSSCARPGPWVCEEALAPSTDNSSASSPHQTCKASVPGGLPSY